ncbi:protein kinase family protein [Floccifex sp.]|uniref:protein kinase family protein n=1 Tax=Floccifex sp. TaxID=2815810 RepID=UPI003F03D476
MKETRYVWQFNLQRQEQSSVDVYYDLVTCKKVVCKTIQKSAHPQLLHQFHMEIQVLSQIQYPFMPSILDIKENQETLSLFETYIPGMNLKDWMNCHPIQTRLFRFFYILQALNCINHLHEKEILYVDIKRENFLIHHQILYLIDFNGCVYDQSQGIYFSSPSNADPELFLNTPKTYSMDIFAFGTFMSSFYARKNWILSKCLKKDSKKRFQSIHQLKWTYIIYSFIKLIIVFILSVFLVLNGGKETLERKYKAHPKDELIFIQLYEKDLSKQKGTYYEKIQSNLYQWIQVKTLKESLKNPEIAFYMMKQAILSQNSMYCQFFIENIPQSIQTQNKELTQFLIQIKEKQITLSFCDQYITYLNQSQELDTLSIFMNLLVDEQIIVSNLNELFELHEKMTPNHPEFEICSIFYLEYCLFLQTKELSLPVPDSYQQSQNEQVQTLIHYLERS